MSATETPDRNPIERLRHWMGERLASRDLNAQLGHEASLRWWHNRALHAAYGVAEGLAVRVLATAPGAEALAEVAPGLAFDGFGREIELLEPARIALPSEDPPAPEGWTLLLAYPAAAGRGPRLRWIPGKAAPGCGGVPIARGAYEPGVGFDFARAAGKTFRFTTPRARPLARPRMQVGATVAGRTDWRAWAYPPLREQKGASAQPVPLATLSVPRHFVAGGIEVEIDARAAGFTDTPCYFAWLHGDPWARAKYAPENEHAPVPLARIVRETPTAFVFKVWTAGAKAPPTGQGTTDFLALARRELYVCWLGIEPHVHPASNGGHHGLA